jgi:hypothetical protein
VVGSGKRLGAINPTPLVCLFFQQNALTRTRIPYGDEQNYGSVTVMVSYITTSAGSAITAPNTAPLSDSATASLIEGWIDESEKRTRFLFETSRNASATGR